MNPPTMNTLSINAVRYEALFVSALQRSEHPSVGQVQRAVSGAVREFGRRGCAEQVAQEFGDHPETAVARMRWARTTVDEAFPAVCREARRVRLSSPGLAFRAA